MEAGRNEKEDLCDQLVRQNEALDEVKREIKEWQKAKIEYQEIVAQMQRRDIFLKLSNERYLHLTHCCSS